MPDNAASSDPGPHTPGPTEQAAAEGTASPDLAGYPTLDDLFALDPTELSPAMRQYVEVRREYGYPEYVLLFQMGDFYETFFDDAVRVGKAIGITVTARGKVKGEGIPLAGFPVRSLQTHMRKLVAQGFKVLVVDQTQDAKDAKGVVERDVTQIVTPGTVTGEDLLDEDRENFVVAIATPRPAKAKPGAPPLAIDPADLIGLAWADVSTGRFELAVLTRAEARRELARLEPREILWPGYVFAEDAPEEPLLIAARDAFGGGGGAGGGAPTITERSWLEFDPREGRDRLLKQFHVESLHGFGVEGKEAEPGVAAAGAVLGYLRETQRRALDHVVRLRRVYPGERMVLDPATCRALELTETLRTRERRGSLIGVLDRTTTPMGARRLREWVLAPLANLKSIRARQAVIEAFLRETSLRGSLRTALRELGDLERIASRVGYGRANARDLAGIRDAIARLPALKELLSSLGEALGEDGTLLVGSAGFDPCEALHQALLDHLVDEPPLGLREGGMIRGGFHPELDELRELATAGEAWLETFAARERERSGVANLKVGYNRVFGYYIEISRAYQGDIPADYQRKQTLKNVERYITDELKVHESKVLRADEASKELEYELFQALRDQVAGHVPALLDAARKLARVDALQGLAELAEVRGYARPELVESPVLEIEEGRHPVIEALAGADAFVPNDARLTLAQPAAVLTGPNMAGKSTYIRQVALIALMAQIGSYVPATRARVGLVDRIFTRLGSADELARGQSTFMVEMTETANILNHATDRSLVILDEIGRGTSTFDGVAIAWAAMEHLIERVGCRTLFATHYHELTELAARYDTVRNLSVAVREWEDEVVFLHEVVEGGTDKSYGIHVGRLAGLPGPVITRAKELLANLQAQSLDVSGGSSTGDPSDNDSSNGARSGDPPRPDGPRNRSGSSAQSRSALVKRQVQMTFFVPSGDPVYELLHELDVNAMTPLDALRKLDELKRLATDVPRDQA